MHLGQVHHLLKLVMEGSKVKKRFLDSLKNLGGGGGKGDWVTSFFCSIYYEVSRPFPSLKNPHFQNEAKCKTFVVKVSI